MPRYGEADAKFWPGVPNVKEGNRASLPEAAQSQHSVTFHTKSADQGMSQISRHDQQPHVLAHLLDHR